jgi:hypothetical protein
MDIRCKELYWLLGRSSPLSIKNELLLYKTVMARIWTYGLELCGCASKSNIAIIQRFQSKLLRAIINAPWYITNAMIHFDMGIPTIQDVIHDRSNKHRAKLQSHPNPLLQTISRDIIPRRLKRRWPTDLQSGVRVSLAGGNLTTSKSPQAGLLPAH